MLGSDPSGVKGVPLGRDVLRRVMRFSRPYRSMLIGFLATIVLAAVIQLAPPLLFRQIIDEALPNDNIRLLHLLAGLVIAAAVAEAMLSFFERWWSSRIGEGLIYDMRVMLFDHVQKMPMGFFTRSQTGALVSRLNNDVIGAQRAVTGTLGAVVSNVIVLVTTLVAMLILEWRLTLLALVLLPIFIIPAKRVGRKLADITREGMNLNASMNSTMTERFGVAGALLVKLFGSYRTETESFSGRAARVRDIGVRAAVYSRTFFIALGLVAAVGTAAVYWVGGQLVIADVITLGTLVALAAYVVRIYQPLTSLTNARVDVMTALVSFDRVFELLDAPNPITDRPGAIDLVTPTGRVEFDHVWFRYPVDVGSIASLEGDVLRPATVSDRPGAWVLNDISIDVAPGTTVALVGPSGAGKTTMASLVPRLWDVTDGTVRVDGHDVRDLTQESLRRAIGVVSQDPHLFHDTVAANLEYAAPDATRDDLVAACQAARIHDVITALPEGYDTVVGERGYRLSGGEKQRLAIARMLLAAPAVVILDEATSHLDSENEQAVQEALGTALEGRTALVIAHRLSTVVNADEILVLDAGRIVERGRHDELVAARGLYASLYTTLAAEPVVG
jgi:ATP-binding cassette, subfamily B, bacterial